MNDKKNITKEEIQEKIRKVDGAMAQEGMPLTEEIKKKLYNCITGKSTYDKERKKSLKSIGEFIDNKYKYTYERTSNYCYKGTDILINKLNITNDKDLYNAERELVAFIVSVFNDNPLKGNFDFQYLKNIHKYLLF